MCRWPNGGSVRLRYKKLSPVPSRSVKPAIVRVNRMAQRKHH